MKIAFTISSCWNSYSSIHLQHKHILFGGHSSLMHPCMLQKLRLSFTFPPGLSHCAVAVVAIADGKELSLPYNRPAEEEERERERVKEKCKIIIFPVCS